MQFFFVEVPHMYYILFAVCVQLHLLCKRSGAIRDAPSQLLAIEIRRPDGGWGVVAAWFRGTFQRETKCMLVGKLINTCRGIVNADYICSTSCCAKCAIHTVCNNIYQERCNCSIIILWFGFREEILCLEVFSSHSSFKGPLAKTTPRIWAKCTNSIRPKHISRFNGWSAWMPFL